ncbi:hypothetical protein EJB05_32912 [Eragrostis curvula]|uniref:Uncharacterized protein n=1 Tax=Eragrostis curvula TaxID=38414 RepID=A0A5J9TZU7_9POAL|nr:hypothetical protein EJB05_32912 [Eragrostis curvula]
MAARLLNSCRPAWPNRRAALHAKAEQLPRVRMSPVGLQTQARDGSGVEFGNRARLILALVTRVLLHLLCVIGADASNRHDGCNCWVRATCSLHRRPVVVACEINEWLEDGAHGSLTAHRHELLSCSCTRRSGDKDGAFLEIEGKTAIVDVFLKHAQMME